MNKEGRANSKRLISMHGMILFYMCALSTLAVGISFLIAWRRGYAIPVDGAAALPLYILLAMGVSFLLAWLAATAFVRSFLTRFDHCKQPSYTFDTESSGPFFQTNIREMEELGIRLNQMMAHALQNASRMDSIVDMVGIPLGAFEIHEEEASVFLTNSLYGLLGIAMKPQAGPSISIKEFQEILPNLRFPQENDIPRKERTIFFRKADAHELWLQIHIIRKEQTIYGVVLDISAEEQQKKWLEFERDFDPLTHLLNRNSYPAKMNELIKADPRRIGVMLFGDLDNLKFINDTYGHDMGDRYIQKAASALQRFESIGGVAARISGDEFAVYLHGWESRDSLRQIVDAILADVRSEYMELPDGGQQKVAISIGLSFYPSDADTIDMLVRYADFAMYEVKHSGKGATREFSMKSYEKNNFILHKFNQLDRLIEYRRLTFAFQPIIDMRTGQVFGYEALLRPLMREIHTPREVLTLAKDQSKLYQIEKLTLTYTLDWYQANRDAMGEKKLFINLIANQRLHKSNAEELERLMVHGAGHVVMEIQDAEQADERELLQKVEMIRRKGYELALDGYGAGVKRERMLLKTRPEYIKLDMLLVRNVDTDTNRQHLLRQIIQYAAANHISVIAEGVETAAEMEMMISLGARYVQGFYTGRPEYELGKHVRSTCEHARLFYESLRRNG